MRTRINRMCVIDSKWVLDDIDLTVIDLSKGFGGFLFHKIVLQKFRIALLWISFVCVKCVLEFTINIGLCIDLKYFVKLTISKYFLTNSFVILIKMRVYAEELTVNTVMCTNFNARIVYRLPLLFLYILWIVSNNKIGKAAETLNHVMSSLLSLRTYVSLCTNFHLALKDYN